MARSPSIELDFFSMEKKDANRLSPAAKPPVFHRGRSFRDLQCVITKMNPEVVKSVIVNGASGCNKSPVSVPSTPKETQTVSSPSPLYDPSLSLLRGCEINAANTAAPLTIFYNGMVSVFNVSPPQAQNVLKVAENLLPNKSAESSESHSSETDLLESLKGDSMPISRRHSLQRFLEKRKGRLIALSPYFFPKETSYSSQRPSQQ